MKDSYTTALFKVINIIIFVAVMLNLSISIDKYRNSKIPTPIEIRENSGEFNFINPLILYKVDKAFYKDEFENLNAILNNKIESLYDKNLVKDISVYFRDMNTGHWTGINENYKYHPSSMLKVLGLMSYMKRSETEPELLEKMLYYKSVNDPGQNYKPEYVLSTGMHSVRELLEQMVVNSDNDVLKVLDKEDKENAFNKTYKTFQLPYASSVDSIDGYMSPRSYSTLFRVLYNATYLSKNNSEFVLSLLSKTRFNKGLTEKLPKNVKVSHKFGEHTYEIEDGEVQKRELHDCGIVYYPNKPYLICIMTSGTDFQKLEQAISELSYTIYSYVDKNKK